jgi:hypothetical protein
MHEPDLRLQSAVDALLEVLDVPREDRYREQAVVFCTALRKNADRERTYDGLWRQDSISEIADMAAHKAKRMRRHEHNMRGPFTPEDGADGAVHEQQIYDAAMDDAIDLVNYAAFTVRLVDDSSQRNRGVSA